MTKRRLPEIPLLIPCSHTSTEAHKTGTWRFATPALEEKSAPCAAACPAGEDIPRIEMMVRRGDIQTAWETILIENPFPGICGHVCFHPCEDACNRSFLDEPLAVHHLERFIGETAIRSGFSCRFTRNPLKNSRIAVLGAGPAGLSAAYFLTLLGFDCTVFEKSGSPGGLMQWGIPRYRLPGWVLEKEISRLREMGVRIECRHPVTPESLAQLSKTYQGIFIGCGHGRSLSLGIPGEALIRDGLTFLSQIRDLGSLRIQGEAAVIGGGNMAIDVARTLIRLGSSPILIYRRRRSDMPAFRDEIAAAEKEGARILDLLSPTRIEKIDGRVRIHLQKMKISGKDFDGRPRIFPDESAEPIFLEADSVFSGIGAGPDEWRLPERETRDGMRMSHSIFYPSDRPVAYGGDLTNDPQSVADAVASGKEAAMAFDTCFSHGAGRIENQLQRCRIGTGDSLSMAVYMGRGCRSADPRVISFSTINCDYFSISPRILPPSVPWDSGNPDFSITEETYSIPEGMTEAARCFHCGTCDDCDNCRVFCPDLCIECEETRKIRFDYCKGCGICVAECPRGVITFGDRTS
ncbi:MAG: FAD-dependent oxidoreductase [Thermodesulfobacteriota bacterium]